MSSPLTILRLTLLIEGALALIYLIWSAFRPVLPLGIPSTSDFLIGTSVALALWAANLFLFSKAVCGGGKLQELSRFRNEIIEPLVRLIPREHIIPISLLAGLGEELFFRGVLLPETGLLLSSILFAVLHFGRAVTRYPLTAVFYAAIGVLLGVLCLQQSLWSAAIAHAAYDALVLYTLKRGGSEGTLFPA